MKGPLKPLLSSKLASPLFLRKPKSLQSGNKLSMDTIMSSYWTYNTVKVFFSSTLSLSMSQPPPRNRLESLQEIIMTYLFHQILSLTKFSRIISTGSLTWLKSISKLLHPSLKMNWLNLNSFHYRSVIPITFVTINWMKKQESKSKYSTMLWSTKFKLSIAKFNTISSGSTILALVFREKTIKTGKVKNRNKKEEEELKKEIEKKQDRKKKGN